MGVRRNLDGHASFVDLPMSPFALPTRSVGGIGRVCVSRHLDGHAGTIGLSIASITLPPAAIAFRARMLRNLDGMTLAKHMAWYSRQKREKNRRAHGHGIGSSHLRLLFSRESGSFLDVIVLQRVSTSPARSRKSALATRFAEGPSSLTTLVRQFGYSEVATICISGVRLASVRQRTLVAENGSRAERIEPGCDRDRPWLCTLAHSWFAR
jgi:hypothetical protein